VPDVTPSTLGERPLGGSAPAGATHLHWSMSSAADFATFRLYRGTSAGFLPGPGNLVAAIADTGLTDAGAAGSYYKLSAVDRNGNESPFALLSPGQITEVSGTLKPVFALEGVGQNPWRGGVMLARFALPSASPATLELVDLAGRRVFVRSVGSLGAGHHEVELAPAHRLAGGVYFLRLAQGPDVRVVRFAVLN